MPTPSTSQYLLDSSREYAIYVCDKRAIPSVTDGLKSGQRIALWLLRNRADKLKTFALSGLMGYERLYVHGETSANDAVNLLAAPYRNNICLIKGEGQFGSRVMPDKKGIGAPRYTEVRRSKAAEAFLYNDLDLVPLVDNYDGSNQMPEHFLPLIPIVLLNGVAGIAVGYSTDILPRALQSIVEATRAALLGQPIKPMVPYYQHYDIRVDPTGKPNQWQYSGKVEFTDSSTIRIIELPPGLAVDAFRKRLIQMEDAEKIVGFIDRSTETINISVKMRRGSLKDWMVDTALDFLKLREVTTERIVVRNWTGNSIQTYDTAEQLVEDFVAWRLGWYTTRFEKLLRDGSYELNYWRALQALFTSKFTNKLGTFADKAAVVGAVQTVVDAKRIAVDDQQIDKIVNVPTYRWTLDFSREVDARILEIEATLAGYREILASPDRLRKVYLGEVEKLRTFKE